MDPDAALFIASGNTQVRICSVQSQGHLMCDDPRTVSHHRPARLQPGGFYTGPRSPRFEQVPSSSARHEREAAQGKTTVRDAGCEWALTEEMMHRPYAARQTILRLRVHCLDPCAPTCPGGDPCCAYFSLVQQIIAWAVVVGHRVTRKADDWVRCHRCSAEMSGKRPSVITTWQDGEGGAARQCGGTVRRRTMEVETR
jgi:hypothetical protein